VPQHIDVDVSSLNIGDSIRLADIEAPAGVTFLDDADETVLASVTQPTRVEEPEEALEEGEEPTAEAEGVEAESTGESDADTAEATDEG
jgi:large subunit ribosomal protein L25